MVGVVPGSNHTDHTKGVEFQISVLVDGDKAGGSLFRLQNSFTMLQHIRNFLGGKEWWKGEGKKKKKKKKRKRKEKEKEKERKEKENKLIINKNKKCQIITSQVVIISPKTASTRGFPESRASTRQISN